MNNFTEKRYVSHQYIKSAFKGSDFDDFFMLLIANGVNRTAALDIARQQLTISLDEGIMTENTRDKKKDADKTEEKPKAAEALLQLIDQDKFEFFHDEQQSAFCKYPSQKSNVYEVRRLRDVKFKSYLSFIYRKAKGKTISDTALKEAISELEGRALYDNSSKREKVFLRAGEYSG